MSNTKTTSIPAFEKHRGIASAFFDPYVIITPEGIILEYNHEFFAFLKDAAVPLVGTNLFELLAFEVGGKTLTRDKIIGPSHTRVDDISCATNTKFLKHNKSLTSKVVTSAMPLYDDSDKDKLTGFFILIRDVTADADLQSNYFSTSNKSITDPLTGQRNRTYLEQYFSNHYDLIQRQVGDPNSNYHVSIILSDLDHFKKINDTYGHQAGDLVLKKTGAVFESLTRKTDIVCRYGGEEFIFILIGASTEQAVMIANKIRQKLENEVFQYGDTIIPVRSSFGVTEVVGTDSDPTIAIKRADEALYKAKKSGRNCVVALKYGQNDPALDEDKPEQDHVPTNPEKSAS